MIKDKRVIILRPWELDKEIQACTDEFPEGIPAFAPSSKPDRIMNSVASIDDGIDSSDDEAFSQMKVAESMPRGANLGL